MEKTVLQHAIEHIQNLIKSTPHLLEINQGRQNAIGALKALRQWERDQIEEAYAAGQTDVFDSKRLHNSSDYFTSKYGNDD